jgi:hypothetical protein
LPVTRLAYLKGNTSREASATIREYRDSVAWPGMSVGGWPAPAPATANRPQPLGRDSPVWLLLPKEPAAACHWQVPVQRTAGHQLIMKGIEIQPDRIRTRRAFVFWRWSAAPGLTRSSNRPRGDHLSNCADREPGRAPEVVSLLEAELFFGDLPPYLSSRLDRKESEVVPQPQRLGRVVRTAVVPPVQLPNRRRRERS